MAKEIKQDFVLRLQSYFVITAYNYSKHTFSIDYKQTTTMTTEQMRKLASFLNETATAIENDKDFTK